MRWGKRSINRLMAVIFIFSLLNAGAYGAVSANGGAPELLLNPGFEEAASGMPAQWVLYGGGTGNASVNEVSGYVREGNRSVKISDPGSAESVGLRSANIPVTPGVSYSASVYSYNTQGVSELYLEYWNSSGVRIDVQTAIHTSQNEWGELAITRAAPSGAAYATLLLYLHVTNIGTAYFDEASFRVADANLGFETVSGGKPAGWADLNPGTSIQSVTDTVYSGTYAVRLDDPSAVYSTGLRSAKLPVESGKLYEASVYSYNLSGESHPDRRFHRNE